MQEGWHVSGTWGRGDQLYHLMLLSDGDIHHTHPSWFLEPVSDTTWPGFTCLFSLISCRAGMSQDHKEGDFVLTPEGWVCILSFENWIPWVVSVSDLWSSVLQLGYLCRRGLGDIAESRPKGGRRIWKTGADGQSLWLQRNREVGLMGRAFIWLWENLNSMQSSFPNGSMNALCKSFLLQQLPLLLYIYWLLPAIQVLYCLTCCYRRLRGKITNEAWDTQNSHVIISSPLHGIRQN